MKVLKLLAIIFLLVSCLIITGNTDAQAEVTVYDADGQFLGVVIAYTGNNVINVYLPSNERAMSISSWTGELIEDSLYFESDNCSGSPYVFAHDSYKIIKNKDKYYIGEKTAPINGIQLGSQMAPWNTSCKGFSYDRVLVPAHEVPAPINLPVALPLSFELEPTNPGKWGK